MLSRRKSMALLGTMAGTAGLTVLLHPRHLLADTHEPVTLSTLIPNSFGDWKNIPDANNQIIDPQQQQSLDTVYSQILARTYADAPGYRIMLSVVYGRTQRGNLQLHHPEICYPAQGFEVLSNRTSQIETAFGPLPVRQLETRFSTKRIEPVSYWALVGKQVVLGSARRKLVELGWGLRGYTADGLLVRISSIDATAPRAFARHGDFARALLVSMAAPQRQLLAGM